MKLIIIFLSFIGLVACKPKSSPIELHSGDLLFQGDDSGQLSEAIDKVTQTGSQTHFSHIGLVEVTDSGVFVLHASPRGGTCVVSLDKFLHSEGDSVTVIAYRLKEQWQKVIPGALARARQLLGKPYNFNYILSDTAHYCSEFVYLAFVADSVFQLEPMTFKDPQTGEFSLAWKEYYKGKGLEIPEGLPGCNPNGMAASSKLDRLGKLN